MASAPPALSEANMDFNTLLPQCGPDVGEADGTLVLRIVDEIRIGVADRDFHIRTRMAVHSLKRHLDMKRILTPEVRVEVAGILYGVVTEERDLDQVIIKQFSRFLTRILKPRGEAEPLELNLPWRPLYHLIDRFYFGKARHSNSSLVVNLGSCIVNLTRQARRYFPAGADLEILDEFRPLCCPQDMAVLKAQGYICLLLRRDQPAALDFIPELMAMW